MLQSAFIAWSLLFSDPSPAPAVAAGLPEQALSLEEGLRVAANVAAEEYGCDPIETATYGSERAPYSRSDRDDTLARVQTQCRADGGTPLACTLAKIITVRESSGRSGVRHRMAKDRVFALNSYINRAHLYGWRVLWPWDDRWTGEGTIQFNTVVLTPHPKATVQNPHYANPLRWSTGLGAQGLSPTAHLWRIDPTLPPEWLCVPENSTKVLLKIWRRAIQAYGATDLVEVNAVFAGSIRHNKPVRRPAKDKQFCTRLASYGLDCHAEPKLFR